MALSTNLVAYYKFDNGALTTDSVASYTLTNTNTIANSSDGKIGYCADAGTTNTNKYLSRDDAYGMTGGSAKSYSFWWKCTTAPATDTSQMMFRHLYGGAADGNYANLAYSDVGGVKKLMMNSSPTTAYFTQTLTVGTWYHFVLTVPASNTGNITCYLNGNSIFTIANWSQNYALTTRLAMFADHAGTSNSPGELDEFGIWSRVLTQEEILALYYNGAGNQYSFAGLYLMAVANTSDRHITSGYGATMQIAHDTVTGDGVGIVTDTTDYIRALKNASGFYLGRLGFAFDTSALPDTATISNASLLLCGNSTGYVNQSATSAVVVGFAPADPTSIAVGDFDAFSYTAFSTIALSSLSQSLYNTFVLNASGIAAVSKTSYTNLGVITEADRAVTTIGTEDNIMSFNMADNSASKPTLFITYTTAVGPANVKTYNGLAAASVKSVNGLAIASVKTFNGLA